MDKTIYAEWLAKASVKKVKEEKEKVLTLPGSSPKDYFSENGDYELAGMLYVGDTLALTLGVDAIAPVTLDAIIRAWASQYIVERNGKTIVDLPLYPITAHLRTSIERGTPIRGWYSLANAMSKLVYSVKAQSILDIARKALVRT